LEKTLASTGRWSNTVREYDYVHGTGTYFCSFFDYYLSNHLGPGLSDGVERVFVVFPDSGAHRRFYTMVQACIDLPLDQILWISKTRVGANITQKNDLFYLNAKGEECKLETKLPPQSKALIADDFTNSGSTIFGAAEIIRSHAEAGVTVDAFVTHFVAKYDQATVRKFVEKLYMDGCGVDSFTCSDSIPNVVGWLNAEAAKRQEKGGKQKIHVMPLAPLISKWILNNSTDVPRISSKFVPKIISTAAPRDITAAAFTGAVAGALVGAAAAVCVVALSLRMR